MKKEYLIAFSSFYKAAYGQDLLEKEGVNCTLRKLPIEIAKSCSTGLVCKGEDIENIKKILERKSVYPKGIYLVDKNNEQGKRYILVR